MGFQNHYPLIAWTVTTTGTADVTGPGGTDSARTVAASDTLAWEPSSVAGVTGLDETLTTAIDAGFGTHGMSSDGNVWHVAPFGVGAVSYDTPFPRIQYNIDAGSSTSTAPELDFSSSAVAKQFGFSTATVTAVPRNATPTADWAFVTNVTIPGVLSFGVVGRRWDPDPGYNASRLRSKFTPSSQTTLQHSSITTYAVEWFNASTRFLTAEQAALSVYADDAGTSTSDTDGTLESMLDADQDDDVDFYLWVDASTAHQVSLVWDRDPSVRDFVAPGSLGTRRVNVTLPFIEVG